SRDGFTPKKFHELCDNKPNTVTFIKIKETEEIIGGYNPAIWKSSPSSWGKASDSFIFSFKNKNNFKDAILSNLENKEYAFWFSSTAGPHFGNDIVMYASNVSSDYNSTFYRKCRYNKMIRDRIGKFTLEDYEVFQIIKK
ncbi:hypothetical protein RhiirA1_471687, partial [Rhizophagus irregularis]